MAHVVDTRRPVAKSFQSPFGEGPTLRSMQIRFEECSWKTGQEANCSNMQCRRTGEAIHEPEVYMPTGHPRRNVGSTRRHQCTTGLALEIWRTYRDRRNQLEEALETDTFSPLPRNRKWPRRQRRRARSGPKWPPAGHCCDTRRTLESMSRMSS